MAKSPLVYLKEQLGFTLSEWQALPEADKTTMKAWAEEEMKVLEIA